MSDKFWKMMDRFFLVLIEITGEKDAGDTTGPLAK